MQKILIVGAGASGVYLSVLLKQKLYDCDVIVLEQNTAPLKKVLATGNGRCNSRVSKHNFAKPIRPSPQCVDYI